MKCAHYSFYYQKSAVFKQGLFWLVRPITQIEITRSLSIHTIKAFHGKAIIRPSKISCQIRKLAFCWPNWPIRTTGKDILIDFITWAHRTIVAYYKHHLICIIRNCQFVKQRERSVLCVRIYKLAYCKSTDHYNDDDDTFGLWNQRKNSQKSGALSTGIMHI